MIPAKITFKSGRRPENFSLHHSGEGRVWRWPSIRDELFKGKTWRFVTDDSAVELVPICDSLARQVESLPPFDRLEIWPVRWGYPNSLVKDHPAEVKRMHKDHFAGRHALSDGNYTWKYWLEHFGKGELWMKFGTTEMALHWLSWMTSPGSALTSFSGHPGCIPRGMQKRIQFCANFHHEEKCEIVWLADCVKGLLSPQEKRLVPGHLAHEKELLREEARLEDKRAKNIVADVKRVAKIQKLLDAESNMEAAKAKNTADERKLAQEIANAPITLQQVLAHPGLAVNYGKQKRPMGKKQLRKYCLKCKIKYPPQTLAKVDRIVRERQRARRRVSSRGKAFAKRINGRNEDPHDS